MSRGTRIMYTDTISRIRDDTTAKQTEGKRRFYLKKNSPECREMGKGAEKQVFPRFSLKFSPSIWWLNCLFVRFHTVHVDDIVTCQRHVIKIYFSNTDRPLFRQFGVKFPITHGTRPVHVIPLPVYELPILYIILWCRYCCEIALTVGILSSKRN